MKPQLIYPICKKLFLKKLLSLSFHLYKSVISFLLILSSLYLNAQYFDYYTGSELETNPGYDIVESGDGGYFFLSSNDGSPGTYNHPQLIKLDNKGQEEWRVEIVYEEVNYIKIALSTEDGGVLLFGTTYTPGPIWNYFAVKYNQFGDEEWKKEYCEGEDPFVPVDVVQMSDSSYVFVCDWEEHFLLLKLSKEFEKIWIQKHELSTSFDRAYTIEPTIDGGFVVGGEYNGFGQNQMHFFKMDSVGSIEWELTYDGVIENDGVITDFGHSAIVCSDGDYAFSGITYGSGNGPVVIKTDQDGDTLWVNKLAGIGFNGGIIANSHEGGILLVSAASGSGVIFTHLSLSGDIEWQKECILQGYYIPRKLHQTSNGGYMLVGDFFYDPLGSQYAFAMVVNGEGEITSQFEIQMDRSKISVFPNPATAYVNFSVPDLKILGNEVDLNILNVNGKSVYQEKFVNSTQVSTNKFAKEKGMYFYEVCSQQNVKWTGKFIVQ